MTLKNVPLRDIVVPTDRFRCEPGECNKLARSIQQIGLIHPIVIDSHNNLIVGLRRLKACDILHMETIPARVIDYDDPYQAERAENEERKDFTPCEAKAVRDYFLAAEREKAKEREREGGKKKGRESFPTLEKGKAGDLAARATGYSGRTLDKVDVVVDAAEAEPEKFAAVAEEMDRTGKVHPAYEAVKRHRSTKAEVEAKRKDKLHKCYDVRVETICYIYEDLPREWRAKVREFIAQLEDGGDLLEDTGVA